MMPTEISMSGTARGKQNAKVESTETANSKGKVRSKSKAEVRATAETDVKQEPKAKAIPVTKKPKANVNSKPKVEHGTATKLKTVAKSRIVAEPEFKIESEPKAIPVTKKPKANVNSKPKVEHGTATKLKTVAKSRIVAEPEFKIGSESKAMPANRIKPKLTAKADIVAESVATAKAEETEEKTPQQILGAAVDEVGGATLLSILAWGVLLIFYDGFHNSNLLDSSPVLLAFCILFHALLIYLVYCSSTSSNPSFIVIANTLLIIEFSLSVFFTYTEAIYTHTKPTPSGAMALYSLYKTFKSLRLIIKYSTLKEES